MPHKFNAERRDKFAPAKYRISNWREYNEALRQRGDLTVWFDADVAQKWTAPRRVSRGGQPLYTDLAIEICLTLKIVFHLPLRQVQGLVRSLLKLMDLDLPVPDFSTLSRRASGLKIELVPTSAKGPMTLIVDSTGLRIHRGSDWCEHKHGNAKARKSWRKLHIGLDPDNGEIVASILTAQDIGDETALPDLLAKVDADVNRFLADGAYDGTGVFNTLTTAFGPEIEIIIPPPKSAVLGLNEQRDAHIKAIEDDGRMAWQKETGYNFRALVEAQIGRWKLIISDGLTAREINRQKTETAIGTKVLNRMTTLGRATFRPA